MTLTVISLLPEFIQNLKQSDDRACTAHRVILTKSAGHEKDADTKNNLCNYACTLLMYLQQESAHTNYAGMKSLEGYICD